MTFFGLLPALIVLFLPGAALLAWLPRDDQPSDPLCRLADAAALSIALTAGLALGFYALGLPPGGLGLGALYGLSLAALVARALSGGFGRFDSRAGWTAAAGLVLLAGLLALRFAQAGGLALPNWVDSVHHALIVRKMVEYGGLPPTLLPYLDLPFYYHYGFHILAAAFSALSGATPDATLLWFGQVLNALLPLALYRLGRGMGLRPLSSGLAALVCGFVFTLPAYYLSWGRYTLLTGLLVLLPAMAAAFDHARGDRSAGPRLALLTFGLALTHYLGLLLFALFLLPFGVERVIRAALVRDRRELPLRSAAWTLAGLAPALPWLLAMLAQNAAQAGIDVIGPQAATPDWAYFRDLLSPVYNLRLTLAALAAGGLAALLPLDRRSRERVEPFSLSMAAWSGLLALLALPVGLRLGPFRPDHYVIVFFIPASLLLGWALGAGLGAIRPRARTAAAVGLALLLAAGGAWLTRQVVNPVTVIGDAADRAALDWVQNNTPPGARFYINSTPWLRDIYRGVDGGYWMMPYTGRGTLVPPALYAWQGDTVLAQVKGWAQRSAGITGCSAEFWDLMREANLGFVYLREGRGALQPSMLADCPRLMEVYNRDGVHIYRAGN